MAIKHPQDLTVGEVFDFGGTEYWVSQVISHGEDAPVEIHFYDPEDVDQPIQVMHLGHQINIIVSPPIEW